MRHRFLLGAFSLAIAGFSAIQLAAQEGPQSQSTDSVAKPKKPAAASDEAPPPEKVSIPSEFKKPKEAAAAGDIPTFRTSANTVVVDVAVMDDHNNFIPKIPQSYFRIVEDGVPQQITNFGLGEAPITICMLIEFSGRYQAYWSQGWAETLRASYGFLETLKPDDNVAVVTYDLRTTILSDFSPDKRNAEEAMSRLRIPGFSESNVFDALTDMADRMTAIEGRKAILLIASGLDTFSKLTFDKARKSLQESGVPIYTVSILQIARMGLEGRGGMGAQMANMDFLQADNEMKTFSKETGGLSFFPRFSGEYPQVFRQIESAMREQYSLSYHPTNLARDGKFRRIKVELIDPTTNQPFRVEDAKHKPIKYTVIAKAGYKAPREVD
jgi:Ca-activated chloride channel family protein